MGKAFSVKEANQLIAHHLTLLSNLEAIASKASTIRKDIQRLTNDLVDQGVLRRLILNDCNCKTISTNRAVEADHLLGAIYRYQKASAAIHTAKSLQEETEAIIRQNISRLTPGPAGLSWFFGGKHARENATLAYQELSRLKSDSYGQMIPHLLSEMDAALSLPIDEARVAFASDPYSIACTLEELCPQTFRSTSNSPFQTILTQLSEQRQKIQKCNEATDKEQEHIKTAAEKMMVSQAMQILRGVPIEEVNREHQGFRVKSLRDAGITTMADVYASSTYQLASLYGVSESAAFSLKRIAQKFLEEAQKDIKIQLSADDRNKQATELVKAIYSYRLKTDSRAKLNDLIQDSEVAVATAAEHLQLIGNGLPWLFFSLDEREQLRDAYVEIKHFVSGEYAKTIHKLTTILSSEKPRVTADTAWKDFQEHNIAYISVLEDIVPGALGNSDSLYGLPEELAREIQEETLFPDGLLCTLRRYQEWGVKYILHQKKILLGDEMGLGKTVQAIATMVSLRNTGATHFIVVCPASVVTNWCREVVKHSRLRVTKIHGSGRNQALKSWVKTGGVAVTTYETTAHIKNESVEKIDLLIVDEAHYIKNPAAQRTMNVKRLCEKAERLLFMTGTALENNVDEMVSLIEALQPDVAASVQGMTFMPNAPQFRNRVAPVYYRRKREDVLTELPELIESKEWCVLNPEEKNDYESNVLSKNYNASRRLSWDADDLKKSCKATRLLEIIEQAEAENRKVLVFSFFLDTIRAIGGLLGTRCYGPINGSVPPLRRQEIIDAFDKAPSGSVLLAQIQSGGTGLNIQSASVVVICEPQLKPSIENQAISRAYRMGQSRNVLVYRLLCVNTIDERITELLEYKQEIFDAFADKSVAAEQNERRMQEVDEKTFGQIIQEEIDRINAEKGIVPSSEAETQ